MNYGNIIQSFLNENQSALDRLTSFMLEYNKKVNLTRITLPNEITEKHYIDSILPLIVISESALYSVPRGTSVLDVGSGAGFPGIPMKLFRPDLRVTLLDSSRKRTDYLLALLRELGVECEVVNGRGEELSHNCDFREKYQLVIARAVANLPALCEYCLPFVKIGGAFLAMKGARETLDGELSNADNVCRLLGGEMTEITEYKIPCGDKRSLAIIEKILQTPTNYPRKRVNITKNPIE
jgi:16S rRNA (guanine527-N7)-methyltransferase